MIFKALPLYGSYIIELERKQDERGFFARAWCKNEFSTRGLSSEFVQFNISYNFKKGTLRGIHYQIEPHQEDKIVRCTKGAVYDVIIDIRPESPTYKKWFSVEISAENYFMLYIPKGFAHGFQTLTDNTELYYQMSEYYHQECAHGIRWNDPEFKIDWPLKPTVISKNDQLYEDYL